MTLWDYVKAIFSIGMEKRNQTSDGKVLALYSALADGVKDNVSERIRPSSLCFSRCLDNSSIAGKFITPPRGAMNDTRHPIFAQIY